MKLVIVVVLCTFLGSAYSEGSYTSIYTKLFILENLNIVYDTVNVY